ncbi:hypothetical protein PRZ48_006138 [Zasmidium cellare]|uniref:Zn(2)-C6 fungal-type domain-containing protein n=1 Tax=Zasmidium cellare TaxID=395010 RepID=A0ABR0EM98_ZASCE|nr:hypothetical protein PRZ48_006138 [Zasmidium cellare]
MVGVPGRSQGCITCRRRRVKCDLRAPHCKRCYKGGKTCEGYEPYRSFVNTFFDSFTDHDASEIDWVKLEGGHQYEFVFENDVMQPQNPFASYACFKNSVQLGLWDCHILQRLFSKQHCDNIRPWVDAVMQSNRTSVGRDAILALAQSLAAREDGAEKEAAAAQYSRAINLLHSNLTNDECKDDLNNLAAIVIFYYYEMTSATHMDGWAFHAAGMAHVVELRGPESFQSGAAKSLFIICRFKIIYQALLQRKRTFLSQPKWKTVPWQGTSSDPKNHIQRLKDTFADLPGLLEDGDALCSTCCDSPSSNNSLAIKSHIDNLVNAFHNLVLWRNAWEKDFSSAVSEIPATKESNLQYFSREEVPHRTVYWYENIRRARETVFFYGTLLHLLDEMVEWLGPNAAGLALGSIPQPEQPATRSPLMAFHEGMTRTDVCAEIYRSLDYLLDGPDAVSGAVQLVYPLRACGVVGTWRLDRVDTINLVPMPIWDKVVRLSGFEMLHPMRATRAAPVPPPVDAPSSVSDDEMRTVLDPALRDSPMQDDALSSLFTLGTDDDKFASILQSFAA